MAFADLHAHSFLCAFQQRLQENDPMSRNPNEEYSVWHQFPVTHNLLYSVGEKVGFTTYSESDFTQGVLSGVKLVNVALYPPERGFFKLSDKTFWEKIVKWAGLDNWLETEMGHYISGFSIQNVDHIKSAAYSYFTELSEQAAYVTDTAPFTPDPAGCVGSVYSNIKNASYVLRHSGAELSAGLTDEVIQVILSVEGGNSLWGNFMVDGVLWDGTNFEKHFTDAGIQAYRVLSTADYRNDITPAMVEDPAGPMAPLVPPEICSLLLDNLRAFINSTKVFSFTFSHHFYNGLGGHCASLQPLTDHNLVDQSFGLGSDITNAGYMVLNELLKNNIVIDVKHMSYNARQSFYRYRANHYPNAPIIASHAAVNGLKFMGGEGRPLYNPNPFYAEEINLYDDDIEAIVDSQGLVGILMDQRVNGVRDSGDIKTLWLQFRYIAERAAVALRKPGVTVWDCVCLGTDFDGVIHPVDEFNTYTALLDFPDFLLAHITAYMQNPPADFLPGDILEPGEILGKICYRNMSEFVKRNYH